MMLKNKKLIIIAAILIALLVIIFIATESAGKSLKVAKNQIVNLENGIQVIHMTESANGYTPNSFTITKGIPVRWEIEATADRTCASALLVPDYQIREFLKPGKNVVEFTPQKTGPIKFSCSMRMFNGEFNVVE